MLETRTAARPVSVEGSTEAGFMAPLHAHEADEAVRVVEGAITVFAGDAVVRLDAGRAYVVPSGVAHTYRAETTRARAVFTTLVTSPSRYEAFVRAVGPVADGGWATDDDAAVVGAVAAAAQITVLGAPGTLPAGAAAPVAA